jgi:uncharacterized protein (DUF1499 family)|tara:strand:- start:4226 stop:4975 length:750 start_codon:yes stop_codon:yes gene_type:complete
MDTPVLPLRWWAKTLLIIAVLLLLLLPSAALGHRWGLLGLSTSFALLGIVMAGGLISLLAAIFALIYANIKGLMAEKRVAVYAMGTLLFPLLIMGFQIGQASSVPSIHDITTDADNPPAFEAAVLLRKNSPNDLEYGQNDLSAEQLWSVQQQAYPEIRSIRSELAVAEAFARAADLLQQQGLEIIATDRANGRIEAVDTTFWFGFKDDLVVRIKPNGNGSIVDLRSVSRVGQSDLGANALRISRFINGF